jgi:hypothetical protein
MVAMFCLLYRQQEASQFYFSYLPLIYYCVDEGAPFKWGDILSDNLEEAIKVVSESQLGIFPRFHVSSYLLEIMCVSHQYLKMGWKWQPSNEPIHVYFKVIWEHKYWT